ncbi:MAG: sensor histidine kinase [Deltaproteobacteria bacterium]|nr:MAG: sensor histidine kinase [Deltaproteobacteria bacterium]
MSPQRWNQRSLSASLARKLQPLVFALALAISLSAPIAYFVLQYQLLQQQSQSFSQRLVSFVQQEAQRYPVMWSYNARKLLQHLKRYHAPEQLECIEIWNQHRKVVGRCNSPQTSRPRALWTSTPIVLGQQSVGYVWVGMRTASLRRNTLHLLLIFTAFGLVLAWALYTISLQTTRTAESQLLDALKQLTQAQIELSKLNQNLEDKVQQRTSELNGAYQQLQHKESRLRELTDKVLALQDEERRAIARELHDSVGQSLTAVRLQLQLLAQQTLSPAQGAELAQQTLAMTDHTIDEVRRAVHRLGPTVVQELGLPSALQRLCNSLPTETVIDLTVSWPESEKERPSLRVENVLYRIAQEALHNITKHADAQEASVTLTHDHNVVTLQVKDNGKGFHYNPTVIEGHGLRSIRERCELLDGTLTVESHPGQGTRLQVDLPAQTPHINRSFEPNGTSTSP